MRRGDNMDEGYEKIKFLTKEKLKHAEQIGKYTIEPDAQQAIANLPLNAVLAIKIQVNSPVKVTNACSISNVAQIDEFARQIDASL